MGVGDRFSKRLLSFVEGGVVKDDRPVSRGEVSASFSIKIGGEFFE